jgi:2-polyprenyl-3-methyl-5-hydroxy-6-metoxy-1,4-benzoquinol methylase
LNIAVNINKERKSHWEKVYATKGPSERSWFQQIPETSLKLINELNLPSSARIMDNGGGDSLLVDNLLNRGFFNITVQDISETALNTAKERLKGKGERIIWQPADAADCCPEGEYDLWHDRAAFHFLTNPVEIENYINTVKGCIKPGGYLIVATFSEEGPPKCSGLNVTRYSEKDITEVFGNDFIKEKCLKEDHVTPFGTIQNFLFCVFRKKNNE